MVQDTCLGCTNCGQLFTSNRTPTKCWICGSSNLKTVSYEPGNFECPKCGEIKENERGIKLHIKLSRDHVRAFKKKDGTLQQVEPECPFKVGDIVRLKKFPERIYTVTGLGQVHDSTYQGFAASYQGKGAAGIITPEQYDNWEKVDGKVQVQQVDQVALAREFIPVMQKYNVTSFFIDKVESKAHIFIEVDLNGTN